ncbi:hypothetical protein [Azohydromonas australica]|uniref:hypothetical protein n=1 Tax=Azohydromonas australica TaxID=364039 RepID=UPI00040482F9|nr:hypothetical protein [Azohydromonas australica]
MRKKQVVAGVALTLVLTTAHAGIVVVGHPLAPALSKEQAAAIFLGRNTSLTPLDQPDSSPIRAAFYRKVAGRDLAQVKAIWSRLLFSGKGQAPRELANAAEVKKTVAANPKAVGYIDKAAVDDSIKVLLDLD